MAKQHLFGGLFPIFSGSMPSIPPYQASVGVLERSKMLPSALEVALTLPTPDTTSHMYSNPVLPPNNLFCMLNCRKCLGSGVVSFAFHGKLSESTTKRKMLYCIYSWSLEPQSCEKKTYILPKELGSESTTVLHASTFVFLEVMSI